MQQILLVLRILVGIGLVAIVLLQHGRGADAGAAFGGGGGGSGSLFGARGPGTVLTRVTAILATVFFLNSLGLAYAARQQSLENRSVMEQFESGDTQTAPSDMPGAAAGASGAPAAEDVPSAPAASSDETSDVPQAGQDDPGQGSSN